MQATKYSTEPMQLLFYPDHPRPSKPTFAQLINMHSLTTSRIARTTQIALTEIQAMVRGEPVLPIVAEAVLAGVERLSGVDYALADVEIATLPHWSGQ